MIETAGSASAYHSVDGWQQLYGFLKIHDLISTIPVVLEAVSATTGLGTCWTSHGSITGLTNRDRHLQPV